MRFFCFLIFLSFKSFAVDFKTALTINNHAQQIFLNALKSQEISDLHFELNSEEPHNLGGARKKYSTAIISMGDRTLESLPLVHFLFIYCHELGHFLGGHPKKSNGWASTEVQSDYWSAQVCLPQLTVLNGIPFDNFLSLHAPAFFEFLAKSLELDGTLLPFYQRPSFQSAETQVFNSEYVSFQCRLDILRAGVHHNPYPSCVGESLHRH
ncbi:MAG: hypothetical protein ACK5V3_16885 [Bdellovibrionales bacterium]